MPRVRKVEIKNFRGIQEFTWLPAPGINCLIGPGDSGKSSILDAIDLCLGARRNIQFTDADFYRLNVENPISISLAVGELDDGLKSLEGYGLYVRGFDEESGKVEDEPEKDSETVLTVNLTVASDLEPSWSLLSDRAKAQGMSRNLSWSDRVRIAPTRVGAIADYHLGWRRGSVLNRVSEERADASAALARAGRDARAAFGDGAQAQLSGTLAIVVETAKKLGIAIGEHVRAMLDAHSVSFSGGTIALHDEYGVPLRSLGVGSTRLLIAGLQRVAAAQSTIVLVDELEHGLEPHRIIQLLDSLGAKEKNPPLQAFMTTHSPVALRELAGSQLVLPRLRSGVHHALSLGTSDDIQSTIRLFPDAFLASSILVCEGASEVGFIRGLGQHRARNGYNAIAAQGTALVDCGGGEPDRSFRRAAAFRDLGYRVAILRDDDVKPTVGIEASFVASGGKVHAWRHGRAIEDELFASLTDDAVNKLLDRAVDLHGEELVNEHIKSISQNQKDLSSIQTEILIEGATADTRAILGRAARTKKSGWFKSVTWMEDAARDIVGPDLENANAEFRGLVDDVLSWTSQQSE